MIKKRNWKTNLIFYSLPILVLLLLFPTALLSNVQGGFRTRGRNEDDIPPFMVADLTPQLAQTGVSMVFAGNFSDDVEVAGVWLNISYHQGMAPLEILNLSLNGAGNGIWQRNVSISPNATHLKYFFFFQDTSNNTNWTAQSSIDVADIIFPVADVGENITVPQNHGFTVDGTGSYDNVHIETYLWRWWCMDCNVYKTADDSAFYFLYAYEQDWNMTLTVTDGAGNQDMARLFITVTDGIPPHAFAGDNIVIDQGETAYFNANASTDNVEITNYTWTFHDGDQQVQLQGMLVNYTFKHPGIYRVNLSVVDGMGNMGPMSYDMLMVTVRDIVHPVANAGVDMFIEQEEWAHFNASLSTDNVGVEEYLWSFSYMGSIREIYGQYVSFLFVMPGEYVITLLVWDKFGNMDSDSMNLTVYDIYSPRADPGSNRETYLFQPVVLNGSRSVDNVGIVNYTWVVIGPGGSFSLYGMEVSFFPDALGEYNITLYVVDAMENSNNASIILEVWDNVPPRIVIIPVEVHVPPGTLVELHGGLSFDHSGIVSYNWSFQYGGNSVFLEGASVNFTFDILGEYTILIFVTDACGNVNWSSMIVEVLDMSAPGVDCDDNISISTGQSAVFNALAWDDTGIVNYTWTFDYRGGIVYRYGKTSTFVFDEPGIYPVLLTVLDIAGNMANDTLWVNVTSLYSPDSPGEDGLSQQNGTQEEENGVDREGFGIGVFLVILAIVFCSIASLIIIVKIYLPRKEMGHIDPAESDLGDSEMGDGEEVP